MKFQPGDKVKVIEPKKIQSPQGCTFVATMGFKVGDVMTIREWTKEDSAKGWVARNGWVFISGAIVESGTHYKVEENSWCWWGEWLELVKPAAFLTDEDFEI
jgi:hypothetical protein